MSAQIPPRAGSRQIEYGAEVMQRQQVARSKVRLSRAKRRVAIVAFYLFLAAMVAMTAISASHPFSYKSPGQAAEFALLLAVLVSFSVISYSVGGFTQLGARLDERERAQRNQATAVAYNLLIVVVIVVTFYPVVASLGKLWLPTPHSAQDLLPLGIALIWLCVTLPNAILAWTLPDPEPDPKA